MRTRHLFVPAAVVAALTIGSLAGCSSNGNSNYVTPQTPSASHSAGESSDTSSSGASSSESLPSDFPKSDVPVVDGNILVARGDKDNGWSVTVQPKSKDGFAEAKSQLEGAGYTQQPGATDSKATYTNGKYTVSVGTPGVAVTYNVTAL